MAKIILLGLFLLEVIVVLSGFALTLTAAVFTTEEEFQLHCANKSWYPIKTWPRNTILYKIPKSWDQIKRQEVRKAMMEIEEKTDWCVKFIPHDPKTQRHKDFIDITDGQRSSSPIGYHVGRSKSQKLTINFLTADSRRHQVILHELLHALGLSHEFARPDRDLFINVLWQNLPSADLYCTNPYAFNDSSIPLDPHSVLQYDVGNGPEYFQLKSDPNIKIRPDGHLTPLDVLKILRLYNCQDYFLEPEVEKPEDDSKPRRNGFFSATFKNIKDYVKRKVYDGRKFR